MVPGQTPSNQPSPATTPTAPPAPTAKPAAAAPSKPEVFETGPPATTPAVPKAQSVTVVQMIEKPTRETTVGDILLGSVGFVGMALLAALVVGLVAGGVLIFVKRLLPDNAFNGQSAEESALKLNALSDAESQSTQERRQ